LARWTSGYPFSVSTYAFPTNYEQDSRAVLLGAAPRTGAFIDSNGDPNVFQSGPAASAFCFAYPGESGQRNNLRGPGYFGMDMSVGKLWAITESQALRFSWDVFNVTNAVRFDVGSLSNYLLYQPSLGASRRRSPNLESCSSDYDTVSSAVSTARYIWNRERQ
jgi:hypothetical protein